MKPEVTIDGKTIVIVDGNPIIENTDIVGESALLSATVRVALDAIVEHRRNIHGPDYDYEGDGCYDPEAALYRVIPKLQAALGEEPEKPVKKSK